MSGSHLLWRGLVVGLFALGVVALLAFGVEPPSGKSIVLAQTSGAQPHELPQRWSGTVGKVETRQFGFEFEHRLDADASLHLYLPYFEQRLSLRLNGIDLTAQANLTPWRGPLSSASALVLLPSEVLHDGKNRIDLTVSTGPLKFGALSRLYLGPETELAPYFRLRNFIEHDLKVIVFGVQAFLALACIILVAAHRREERFAWLGLSMVTSCLFSLGTFGDTFPQVLPIVPWAFMLAPPAAIGFLGFAASLEGIRRTRALTIAAIMMPTMGYILILSGMAPLAEIVLWVILPITAASLSVALVILVRLFWCQPSADLAFLVSGLLLMMGAVVHDQFLRLGYLENGVFLAQPARLLTLVGIAIFLMLHLARITRELDQAARTLSERLRQREDELAVVFERERTLAEKAASQSERTRIMAELHDGVAGHLSTIVALSDAEQTDHRGIQTVARHALGELRMVIDALVMPEGDLRIALASLRERSIDPLRRLGIETEWSMVHLPDVKWMSPEQTLSVLRILQEAISNAVRHGMPQTLHIKGEAMSSGKFAIHVVNAGGKGFHKTSEVRRYGVQNMARRAEALGGETVIRARGDGAEFTLILPTHGPESV